MKSCILSFRECQVLLVVLPSINNIKIEKGIISNELVQEEVWRVYDEDKYLFRSPFPIEIFGKLSDITEKQLEEIVEVTAWSNQTALSYRDYSKEDSYLGLARESFYSKMRAHGFYIQNPHTNTKVSFSGCTTNDKRDAFELINQKKNQAESLTYPPEQTFVFLIEKKQS